MKVKELIALLQAQDPEIEVDMSISSGLEDLDTICSSVGADIVGGVISEDTRTHEKLFTLSNDPEFVAKMNS